MFLRETEKDQIGKIRKIKDNEPTKIESRKEDNGKWKMSKHLQAYLN